MNYKGLGEINSGFVRWVLSRHPLKPTDQNGFIGGFIFGERGKGKSTYCYKTMALTYYLLNGFSKTDDEEESYRTALEYIMYDPSEFRQFLIHNKLKRIVTPIICLDDASMHFGNMLHVTNPFIYSALMGETATIRTAVTGFLLNAPKRKHVVAFLRDYDDFKGEIKQDIDSHNKWNRKVRYYKWNYYPDETKYRIQIPFQDKYSCYIPEPYYSWYVEKKRYYELKHELEVADRIDKNARKTFIENKEYLPQELHHFVEKWEKQQMEQQKEQKIDIIQEQMRMENLKKKIKKFQEAQEQSENIS